MSANEELTRNTTTWKNDTYFNLDTQLAKA